MPAASRATFGSPTHRNRARLIGLVFVVLGLGLGESGYAMLKTIPNAVLGGLLLSSGIELAVS